MILHQKLKQLRREKKISQRDLADQFNIHFTHLNRIENGKALPSFETFLDMIRFFDVSADYLLNDNIKEYEKKVKNKSLYDKLLLLDELDSQDSKALEQLFDSLLLKSKALEDKKGM